MFTPDEKAKLAEQARRVAASCLEISDALEDDEDETKSIIALFHFISLSERVNTLSTAMKNAVESNIKREG